MGSGSVAIAALELKRNYIGCEINPAYIEISNRRLEAVRKQQTLKL